MTMGTEMEAPRGEPAPRPEGGATRFGARRIKLNTLLNIILAICLAAAVIFSIAYLRGRAPVPVRDAVTVARLNSNRPPGHLFNLYGPADSPLSQPLAVAAATDGQILVADSGNGRVQVFDRRGKRLARWGGPGGPGGAGATDGAGLFGRPVAVLARDGRVYVADLDRDRVAVLTRDGRPAGIIPDPQRHGDLSFSPLALARDAKGNLYVATKDQGILIFDPEDKLVRQFGRFGQADGEFAFPNGVAVDSQGRVWVADSNNGRVQIFSPEGKFLNKINGFALPRGIAVDSRDRIYVVDILEAKVFALDSETGKELFTFGGGKLEGERFNFPNGLYIDGDDQIYVADRDNHRISVWGF